MHEGTEKRGTEADFWMAHVNEVRRAVESTDADELVIVEPKSPYDVAPKPGQFYMLRAHRTGTTLARPVSVYSCDGDYGYYHNLRRTTFLIQPKGQGTTELCTLDQDDFVDILGPLGNGFPMPEEDDKVCIVGGGIGVAPVAFLAETLEERSYDFYACFKGRAYGLGKVKARELYIASEDGTDGNRQGMLDAILNTDVLWRREYSVVYACGPTGMLRYVQKICAEAGVKCWLSLESHMACGVGACLGCSVTMDYGKRRCCKDGPVFDGIDIVFDEPKPSEIRFSLRKGEEPDLSVEIAGVKFTNPIIAASGTFGYGTEYAGLVDVARLGGICSKGLTLEPREGNEGVRVYDVSGGGVMNSIGLENPGIVHFIEHELPTMQSLGPATIANLSGSTLEDYVEGARLLDGSNVQMIELNISCPNVKAGGMAFGMTPEAAGEVTSAVRDATLKPLIVKLSPNAPDIAAVAMAAWTAGADAVSLVNTFQALAVDIETGAPVFKNVYAGLSGPAIKPIALRMVHQVAKAFAEYPEEKRIPIIGLGGIATWEDAVEFLLAGASAVQVGTATFANPGAMEGIIRGLSRYMHRKGFHSLAELHEFAAF